jgi:hypothetical protein
MGLYFLGDYFVIMRKSCIFEMRKGYMILIDLIRLFVIKKGV